jgi:UDP-N-acetylmuramate: L-alanyl-gamma-D-glutamyl-meso-diaminopimelate ligase
MKIHILGVCGTFMGGIAQLAKKSGIMVSGCDEKVYPPMSEQLISAGIELSEGFEGPFPEKVDCVIVGNAMSRGNAAVETMLNQKLPFNSGPQWLAENILPGKHVLAVAGTHGKTTTSSLLAWVLSYAGLDPGFLIGGVPNNFGVSARLTDSPYFVIEADEYDSAFFDKRSKCIHYRPDTLILNNLEFDHADIFPDLSAIKQQFHYLVRTVPSNGLVVVNQRDDNLASVLEKGCWTPTLSFGGDAGEVRASCQQSDKSIFEVIYKGRSYGELRSPLLGSHNAENVLAVIAAASHVGVSVETAMEAVTQFKGVRRRMEVIFSHQGLTAYDDFAHHPTAITETLSGLRKREGKEAALIAVMELGSYSMQAGIHEENLGAAFLDADEIIWKQPPAAFHTFDELRAHIEKPQQVFSDGQAIAKHLASRSFKENTHILVMSNKGFDGLPNTLKSLMKEKAGVL